MSRSRLCLAFLRSFGGERIQRGSRFLCTSHFLLVDPRRVACGRWGKSHVVWERALFAHLFPFFAFSRSVYSSLLTLQYSSYVTHRSDLL